MFTVTETLETASSIPLPPVKMRTFETTEKAISYIEGIAKAIKIQGQIIDVEIENDGYATVAMAHANRIRIFTIEPA